MTIAILALNVLFAVLNLYYSVRIIARHPRGEWKPGGKASGWVSAAIGSTQAIILIVGLLVAHLAEAHPV